MRITKPFGLWPSPITPAAMAASRRLNEVLWDSDGETLVWLEGHAGRSVLVAATGGGCDAPRELAPTWNARGGVGYGGGDFAVGNGQVVFVDAASARLMRLPLAGGSPTPLTPAFGAAAAPAISADGRFVAYVHSDDDGPSSADRLAVVALTQETPSWPQVLTSGHDFYSSVRWSPDGQHLAFIAWDHPQMPWQGSLLYLARVDGNGPLPVLRDLRAIAGGPTVSVSQPEFTGDGGSLVYTCDASGWGHFYKYDLSSGTARQLTHGVGLTYDHPAWVQGLRTFALRGGEAVALADSDGYMSVKRIDLQSGDVKEVVALSAYTSFQQISAAPNTGHLAVIANSPHIPSRLVVLHRMSDGARVTARSQSEAYLADDLSKPEPLVWQASDGSRIHGLYSAPTSQRFEGVGQPPLIVYVHGGPTDHVGAGWRAETQFFTSRGFAVLAVNHRGSSGYGRAYMDALKGRWGELDVEDAVTGARHLVALRRVDGQKIAVMGGSAGGYTVLQAMVSYPEFFAAGIVLFGIANQFTLAAGCHKFESHYSDWLLGPLPQAAPLYRERSPLFHAARICRPLAVYHGSADKVVPPDQSEAIVQALRSRGVPHIYHVYEGEGHGFRKADSIEHLYRTMEAFLRQHLLYQ